MANLNIAEQFRYKVKYKELYIYIYPSEHREHTQYSMSVMYDFFFSFIFDGSIALDV